MREQIAKILEGFNYIVSEDPIPPVKREFDDALHVKNVIWASSDQSLIHEAGHAIADCVFYNQIFRRYGINWCIGATDDAVGMDPMIRVSKSQIVSAAMSEDLAVECSIALMRFLKVGREMFDNHVNWVSGDPNTDTTAIERVLSNPTGLGSDVYGEARKRKGLLKTLGCTRKAYDFILEV